MRRLATIVTVLTLGTGCNLSDVIIKGAGTVELFDRRDGDRRIERITCSGTNGTCEQEFNTTSNRLKVVATPAEGWRRTKLTTNPPLEAGDEVTPDTDEGVTITAEFVKIVRPACTPTTSPGAPPTLETPQRGTYCIKQVAFAEGTKLGGVGTCLDIGGQLMTVDFGDDGLLRFEVAEGTPTGTQDLTVVTTDGEATTSVEVRDEPAPEVPEPPTSGQAGVEIVVTGTGLSHVDKVAFEAYTQSRSGEATMTKVSDTELRFTLPADLVAGPVAIRLEADCGIIPFNGFSISG